MMLDTLAGFLSGYFHQDWDLEADDPAELVERFASTEDLDTVTRAIGEATVLLAAGLDDGALAQRLLQLGCYYRPAGSIGAWFGSAVDAMAATAATRLAPTGV